MSLEKIHFVLIVDVSHSMNAYRKELKQSLSEFKTVYNASDIQDKTIHCVFFNSKIVLDCNNIPDLLPKCRGNTALYSAILKGVSGLKNRQGKLVIGILTDGENNQEPFESSVAGAALKEVKPDEVYYYCPDPEEQSRLLGLPISWFHKFDGESFKEYSSYLCASLSQSIDM